jgi:hypothetical protein
MSVGKAFWRGFREGWVKTWNGEMRYSIAEVGLMLLFWEWINGRLL